VEVESKEVKVVDIDFSKIIKKKRKKKKMEKKFLYNYYFRSKIMARKSKISPYLHLLGRIPDQQIACRQD
jgi:hypothetical protein